MRKANRTIETVEFMRSLSQQVVDCSSIVLDNGNFSADSAQVQYMRLVCLVPSNSVREDI